MQLIPSGLSFVSAMLDKLLRKRPVLLPCNSHIHANHAGGLELKYMSQGHTIKLILGGGGTQALLAFLVRLVLA